MKATQLIKELEEIIKEHGDLKVVDYEGVEIDKPTIHERITDKVIELD